MKTTKFKPKPAQNALLSLPSPSRTNMRLKTPEYQLVLRKFGFLRERDPRDAWGMWQIVVADPVVSALCAKIEAKRAFLKRSAASANKDARQVLGAMTPAQRAALKRRLGISQ